MNKLWIFQTNKQEFLDDCRNYGAYGVPAPRYPIVENDSVLIRLKIKESKEYGYLGPFTATSMKKEWVSR